MIRVLHYIPGFMYGGIESMFLSWYRSIDKTKIEFELLIRTQDDEAPAIVEYKKLGGKYYRLRPLSVRKLNEFRQSVISFFSQHHDYDIIHVHESDPFIMHEAKRYGIEHIIVHSHTTSYGQGDLKGKLRFLEEQYSLKHYADFAFACSDLAAKWKYGSLKFKGSPVTIIRNAIDSEKYNYNNEARIGKRRELNLESNYVLINVGRISPPKNQYFLIDIFCIVVKNIPNSILIIVGDGPGEEKLKAYAREKGIEGKTIFTGVRSDVAELLQAADCFILPSRWEGLPVTMVEAQASGLPCLVSDVITREADITDEVFRLSINEDPQRWADEIERIRDDYNRTSKRDAVVRSGFDVRTATDTLVARYEEIVRR